MAWRGLPDGWKEEREGHFRDCSMFSITLHARYPTDMRLPDLVSVHVPSWLAVAVA